MTLFCFVNLSYSGQNEQWESINIWSSVLIS
jgi:hypothetical protein